MDNHHDGQPSQTHGQTQHQPHMPHLSHFDSKLDWDSSSTSIAYYYCPIPECEVRFATINDLSIHINQHSLTFSEVSTIVDQTYALKTPWWFTNEFISALNTGTNNKLNLHHLYSLKFNTIQHKIGNYRYKKYLNNKFDQPLITPSDSNNNYNTILKNQKYLFDNDENNDDDIIDSNHVLAQLSLHSQALKENSASIRDFSDATDLQSLYKELSSKLATSMKVNKIVTTQLATAVNLKRKQYVINQILLDANLEVGEKDEKKTS